MEARGSRPRQPGLLPRASPMQPPGQGVEWARSPSSWTRRDKLQPQLRIPLHEEGAESWNPAWGRGDRGRRDQGLQQGAMGKIQEGVDRELDERWKEGERETRDGQTQDQSGLGRRRGWRSLGMGPLRPRGCRRVGGGQANSTGTSTDVFSPGSPSSPALLTAGVAPGCPGHPTASCLLSRLASTPRAQWCSGVTPGMCPEHPPGISRPFGGPWGL